MNAAPALPAADMGPLVGLALAYLDRHGSIDPSGLRHALSGYRAHRMSEAQRRAYGVVCGEVVEAMDLAGLVAMCPDGRWRRPP